MVSPPTAEPSLDSTAAVASEAAVSGPGPVASTALPRIMVTAPGSGHGKTTVATGLMAALRAAGLVAAGFKVGPDFIDPGYHALATGRPGRNLDPVLCGEDRLAPLLLHGAAVPEPADVAVIEGVMGLFDGQLGGEGFASTAHVARLLRTPLVLVLDVSAVSRTAAAIVHGLHTFEPDVRLAGVILNKAGSRRHSAEIVAALEATGLPVLGILPRDAGVEVPSRHLGLVTAAEQPAAAETVRRLGAAVAEHLDLTGLLALAHTAPPLAAPPWDPAAELSASPSPSSHSSSPSTPETVQLLQRHADGDCNNCTVSGDEVSPSRPRVSRRPVVAVAGGRAFTFRYAETDELLRAAGCEPVEFDPLTDPALPAGTAGLYLGGGFPEVHAAELSANTALRADIAGAIAAGLPTVAECAGLLYLCATVDGAPMIGAIPGDATMTGRLTLGYRTGVAPRDTLLGPAGTRAHGHEFHRTQLTGIDSQTKESAWLLAPTSAGSSASADEVAGPEGSARADRVSSPGTSGTTGRRPRGDGYAAANLHASYLHVHWAGHPQLAARFAAAVHDFAARAPHWEPGTVAAAQPEPDLDHHGDAEVGEGLVDLAVNVRVAQPPQWLADTVAATISRLAAYPNPAAATRAIAAAHPLEHPSRETVQLLQRHAEEQCNTRTVFGEVGGGERAGDHVLPTAGAAESFTLIARALSPRHPVVVHPQFTEPEAALRAAGHAVRRVLLRADEGFRLDPSAVPPDADLVVIGNPTNPTSVLHPREAIRQLSRPGRVLVVDEAFMDAVPGEPATLLDGDLLDNTLVLRSLTKTWGVAGLRAGYVVGDPALVARLRAQQPPWSTSSPALAVIEATLTPHARQLAAEAALEVGAWRDHLVGGLAELGLSVVPEPQAPFVLVDAHGWPPARDCAPLDKPRAHSHASAPFDKPRAPSTADSSGWLRETLRRRGFAVRRCDTFPGLDADWVRIAVRDPATSDALLKTLHTIRAAEIERL